MTLQSYIYFREREREKKKKEFPVLTPSAHTSEITVQHHAEFKQWGDSDPDSVTSDSDRLRFIFSFLPSPLFAFISLSSLNESLRRWGQTHTKAWQCTVPLLSAELSAAQS